MVVIGLSILIASASCRAYSGSVRELTTCPSCHRYIATDFSYCPYCGSERARNYEFRRLLDEPFDAMEVLVQEYSLRRLESIGERLEMLEVDLDAFLKNASGSGR
jgi:hypothetical protein